MSNERRGYFQTFITTLPNPEHQCKTLSERVKQHIDHHVLMHRLLALSESAMRVNPATQGSKIPST
jgi:hypothetical protein